MIKIIIILTLLIKFQISDPVSSMEYYCNTTSKYCGNGKFSKKILPAIHTFFPPLPSHLLQMTFFCKASCLVEPLYMSSKDTWQKKEKNAHVY